MPSIPGLTRAEADAAAAGLAAPGARTRRRATVLNLDHEPIGSLTGILGGQVRWNTDTDVHTDATVVASDIDDHIDLDLRHLVRCELGVDTDAHGTLWVPLVTGWVQKCHDTGWETEVLLHGKEKIGLRASGRGRAKRGERVGEVIYRMNYGIGERHIVIPDHLRESGPKLADAVEWGSGKPEKSVTMMSRRLAKRAELQVLFDQLGRLDLRPIPDQPSVVFTETDDRTDDEVRLLEPIDWAADYSELCNDVIGAAPHRLRSRYTTRSRYDFSPSALVRGGQDMYLTHRFTDDTIDDQAELDRVTERVGRRLSTARAQVKITATPGPWALAEDLIRAEKRNGKVRDFWLGTGALDFDGSAMSVGYRLVLDRAKMRKNNPRRKGRGRGRGVGRGGKGGGRR